nr:zinc finger protein 329 isoform X1 [Maylandia zebra]
MFYWMKSGSSGGPEPVDSVGNTSKSDILRGIVTEKMSTAAREILAVVERTVADYEEEAAGFRREIGRQRRLLELLQPNVSLEKRVLQPDVERHEVEVVPEDREEQQPKQQTGVKDTESLALLWYDDIDDDEEEQELVQPTSSRQKREDLKDPDYKMPSRVPTIRKKPGRPRISDIKNHIDLRVRILEDSHTNVLSKTVFKKFPAHDLKCPLGLQEADFLDLLKSTFPQLADDEPFDLFTTDRSRRLQPLKVKIVTPEEIHMFTGNSALYIRLKTSEEGEKEFPASPTNDDCPSSDADITKNNEAELQSSSSDQHTDSPSVDMLASSTTSQKQDLPTDEEACEREVDSKDEHKALAVDKCFKPVSELQVTKKMKKQVRKSDMKEIEKSKIACKVCGVWYLNLGSLIKHTWSHLEEPQGGCGVCGEQFESVDELKRHIRIHQKTHDCSYCGKSFFSIVGLNSHISLHTGDRPFKCKICSKTFAYMSGLNVHHWVHVEEKPHKCDICPKSFGLKAQLQAHSKTHTSKDRYVCNICGKSVCDLRSLTRHKFTHSGERPYGCQICGKRFKLSGILKSHEKIHMARERPFLCHVCCKSFLSNCSLMTHMKTHSSERPHVCGVCSKGFVSNGELKAHMRVHTGEAPYGCSECGRFFKRKTYLTNHIRSHLGIKRFVCAICGKACSRQEHLRVHMRTHNGERPYQCTICEKAFTQSHCLKTHMKSHQVEENSVPSPSTT